MGLHGSDSVSVKEKPLVSVIIPTHNRAALLCEALDSVKAQVGVGELFEMEVIVVDDASSDNTPEVMRRCPDVQYIRLDNNGGASVARNTGIRASKGKYIALLDDDDLWLPHRLKAHVPLLESHREVGVAYGQIIVKGDGPDSLWPDADRAPSGAAFNGIVMEEFVLPHTVLIRREAFENTGYFDENLRTMEHYDMFLRLSFYVPFVFTEGALAIGRFTEHGKWFTNIRGGKYEEVVPYIVERALQLVPNAADRAELRRNAHISWLGQITYWLERTGKIDRMRNYVITKLKTERWMILEPSAKASVADSVNRVVHALAVSSKSPVADVRGFSKEISDTISDSDVTEAAIVRQLVADAWTHLAITLANNGSPQHRRAAGAAAVCAVLQNPALLARSFVLKILVRSLLASSRWDPIIAALKRSVSHP